MKSTIVDLIHARFMYTVHFIVKFASLAALSDPFLRTRMTIIRSGIVLSSSQARDTIFPLLLLLFIMRVTDLFQRKKKSVTSTKK